MSTWEDKILKPDGVKLAQRRADKAEHDIQIVDHQVQHHVDVQSPPVEDTQAVRFKEHRPVHQRLRCSDGGVEPFQQTYLQDPAARGCLLHQGIGFRQADGDGLFQQDIEATV